MKGIRIFFQEKLNAKILQNGQPNRRRLNLIPRFFGMQKIASITIVTLALLKEGATLLRLIPQINLIVLPQLMRAMRELTPGIIGTESILHELSTKLKFLFFYA